MAWMSVDNKVYLWHYQSYNNNAHTTVRGSSSSDGSHPSSLCSFTVPSGQCVVTLGLVRPKPCKRALLLCVVSEIHRVPPVFLFLHFFRSLHPLFVFVWVFSLSLYLLRASFLFHETGVFKSMVEWCLIVTTPDEVLLCALTRSPPPPTTTSTQLALTQQSSMQQQQYNSTIATTDIITTTNNNNYYTHHVNGINSNTNSAAAEGLVLVPTSFSLYTDQTRILSVAGTSKGRIFLGGDDGCVYEMTYSLNTHNNANIHNTGIGNTNGESNIESALFLPIEERLDQFYDGDLVLPPVIEEVVPEKSTTRLLLLDPVKLGKRAWSTLATATAGGPRRQPKCAKINRTDHVPAALKAVVPDFVLRGASFLFGGDGSALVGGKIVQIVVDEERDCLYTLSSEGWIGAFACRSGKADLRLAAVMDGPRTARLYLETVSRGQGFPPSTSHLSSSIGKITFPGGGASALGGVGGMEGARAILQQNELQQSSGRTNGRSRQPSNDSHTSSILRPCSIHVISTTESSRLTLLAVTEGGLRFYLSSLYDQVISNGPNAASVGRYGSGSTRAPANPMALANRLTLCHIRAPPPVVENNAINADLSGERSCGVIGGVAPVVSRNKQYRVHASSYNSGVFVSALMNIEPRNSRSSTNGNAHQRSVGDIVVATCPDRAGRKLERSSIVLDKNDEKDKEDLAFLGSMNESMMLPMSTAYNEYDAGAQLPGGIVWDIAEVATKGSSLMHMTANSTTPSETELGIGLPPPFFCTTKKKSIESPMSSSLLNGRNVDASATNPAAKHQSLIRTNAMQVFVNVAANFLLSRPVRYGLTFDKSFEDSKKSESDLLRNYRVSKRDSSKGFSATAGEGSSRAMSVQKSRSNTPLYKDSTQARSARLRPWILKPPTSPLNFYSTYFTPQSKDMVALNAGGLHYFSFISTLSSLADALVHAGDNVNNDFIISSFFIGYGYREGCCLCLALAIGCGPADRFSEQMRRRAASAALARAYVPRLVARVDQTSSQVLGGAHLEPTDPLVPQGYDFKGSALCDGLMSLFARLVRPIWHKPAVVVTEGRLVKMQFSSTEIQTPAKVELLLDEPSREELTVLCHNLLTLMKSIFTPAITAVPGAPRQADNMMDIDENGDNLYLTRALQNSYQRRTETGSFMTQLSNIEAEHLARLLEEKNIHSTFRLVSRIVQLLNLLSLLGRAHDVLELEEIEWGLLHGLTMAQLVQTSEGQDRVETLLNSLVTKSASFRPNVLSVSVEADQVATLFAEQCYLFFSPGSHFAYLGLRQAREALTQPLNSLNRIALGNQASQHFHQAAQHWHSSSLITGRIQRNQTKETMDEIASCAIRFGSPLAKISEALMDLEDVASIVQVCLTTAANFKCDELSRPDPSGSHRPSELDWEYNLYHKRRGTLLQDNNSVVNHRQQKSAAVVEYSTEVTGKDAVETCYALILYHLSSLLQASTTELAKQMLSACAASSEASFLEALFVFLLDHDYADTLLTIDIPILEKWLRDRKDPDMLFRYFTEHRRHLEAGNEALDMAESVNSTCSLSLRIDWLSRSLQSFKSARAGQCETETEKVERMLSIATLQNRLLDNIQLSKKNDLLAPDLFSRLNFSMLTVSELFNDVAAFLGMYEDCLLILHACGHDDVQTIEVLWKNIICEEFLPCATRDERIFVFLQKFVNDIGRGDEIVLLEEHQTAQSNKLLEDGEWIRNLSQRIVTLGKRLTGTGASFIFPVSFIMSNLEGRFGRARRYFVLNFDLQNLLPISQFCGIRCVAFSPQDGQW